MQRAMNVGIFCSNIAKFFLNNNRFDCNTLDLVLVWSLPPTCKNIIIFTYSVNIPELVTELHFFFFSFNWNQLNVHVKSHLELKFVDQL